MENDGKNLNIQPALQLLNQYLAKNNLVKSFIITGGAAIELLGIQRTGGTRDIDIIGQQLDADLTKAAIYVAQKLGLDPSWLNASSCVWEYSFPKGWDTRVVSVFSGKSLEVFSICRMDLLVNKLCAQIDRGFDRDDIVALNPTKEELNKLRKIIKTMKSATGHLYTDFDIEYEFEDIERELGYDE